MVGTAGVQIHGGDAATNGIVRWDRGRGVWVGRADPEMAALDEESTSLCQVTQYGIVLVLPKPLFGSVSSLS
jgi:hypothetical protein